MSLIYSLLAEEPKVASDLWVKVGKFRSLRYRVANIFFASKCAEVFRAFVRVHARVCVRVCMRPCQSDFFGG